MMAVLAGCLQVLSLLCFGISAYHLGRSDGLEEGYELGRRHGRALALLQMTLSSHDEPSHDEPWHCADFSPKKGGDES